MSFINYNSLIDQLKEKEWEWLVFGVSIYERFNKFFFFIGKSFYLKTQNTFDFFFKKIGIKFLVLWNLISLIINFIVYGNYDLIIKNSWYLSYWLWL